MTAALRSPRDLRPLLVPRSLVVVGASDDPLRIGGRPLHLARMHGFGGAVAGVNPKYTSVQGFPCFADLAEVPFTPELAILAIGARDVLPALRACVERGVRAAVVFAGGFAELGTPEGRALQQEVKTLARDTGLLVAGPNAIGLVNVQHRLYATFMTAMVETPPAEGGVAIVAQSGGAVIAVHNMLHARGVGLRYLLNTGNEACIDFSDYLDHVAADPGTRVVAGYVEGLDDGERLVSQLLALRDRDLPVVLYKVGETSAGANAAASHTARLAGSHAVFRAAFEQLGVLRADDMEQLAELSYLATFAGRSTGTRVGVLTTSGAFAAILADKFGPAGIRLPALSAVLQARLKPCLPPIAITTNPVDITANAVNAIGGFGTALSILLDTAELDFVVLFSTSNLVDKLADEILRAVTDSGRLMAVMVTGHCSRQADLEAAGVPVFHDVGRGADALATLARRAAQRSTVPPWRRPPPGRVTAAAPDAGVGEPVARILSSVRERGGHGLTETEGKELLAGHGVEVTRDVVCRSAEQARAATARTGFPAVMKIQSPDIVHKTEVGGVRVGLRDEAEVGQAYGAMRAAVARAAPEARIDGVVLQRQVDAGVELLVSVRRDPLFGLVLTVGIGGVTTELVDDVQLRLLPVDAGEVRAMLGRLRMFPLLAGYRNRPGCSVNAVVRSVMGVVHAAESLGGQLDELEINPLIAEFGPEGTVVAVDCVVRLRPDVA